MDRMKLTVKSPNEDEFALCNLCFKSPYMTLFFPWRFDLFKKYLTFQDASNEELEEWRETVQYFYKKVLFEQEEKKKKQGNPSEDQKRLVLKSPAHTARVRLFWEMFPDSKFIHLSRNPYTLFQSTLVLHASLTQAICFQHRTAEDLTEYFVEHMEEMERAYIEQVKHIPQKNVIEVKYEDFTKQPTSTLEKIYNHLDLPGFQQLKPQLIEFEEQQHKNYKKNALVPLTQQQKAIVNKRWQFYFERFGYPMDAA